MAPRKQKQPKSNMQTRIAVAVIVICGSVLIGRRLLMGPESYVTVTTDDPIATLNQKDGENASQSAAESRNQADSASIDPDVAKSLNPEFLKLKEGDVEGLRRLSRKHLGLEVTHFEKHADGTYSAEFSAPEQKLQPQGALLPPERERAYQKAFADAWNEGRKIELTSRDRDEIAKFDKLVGATGR